MTLLIAPETAIPGPESLDDTGIRRSLLEEIALKIVYLEGEISLRQLSRRMGLALPLVDELFQRLRKAQLCEVVGMDGSIHRLATSSQGRARAQELLARSLYAGTAPVSLEDYVTMVRAQSTAGAEVRPEDVRRAFSSLVLDDDTLRRLGVAAVSGTSLVLHGPTGTGKTAIAERMPDIFAGAAWIPHAVEVDGQIITVFDPGMHRPVEPEGAAAGPFADDTDGRWVLCERPRVSVGGELTIEMLDLQLNPATGYYTAPLQVKANNGVLVLDDFGRQRIRPEELLNRWIVPLDRRVDYLTLHGGRKFEVPFELLVVFSTNLDPATGFAAEGRSAISDEAFLRRIPNKVEIGYATPAQFHEIFQRLCARSELAYEPAIVDRLIGWLTAELGQPLRPCYPRDIVRQVGWEAQYEGRVPALSWEAVVRACHAYFLLPSTTSAPAGAAS